MRPTPKLRRGSYFPAFLEPRRLAKKALTAAIGQELVFGQRRAAPALRGGGFGLQRRTGDAGRLGDGLHREPPQGGSGPRSSNLFRDWHAAGQSATRPDLEDLCLQRLLAKQAVELADLLLEAGAQGCSGAFFAGLQLAPRLGITATRLKGGLMADSKHLPAVAPGPAQFLVRVERRGGTQSLPWRWSICTDGNSIPILQSRQFYRSADDAWKVGQEMLFRQGFSRSHNWRHI